MKYLKKSNLVIIAFLFSYTLLTSQSTSSGSLGDCVNFAMNTYDAAISEGLSDSNASLAADATYDFCTSNGGNPGDAVVVIHEK